MLVGPLVQHVQPPVDAADVHVHREAVRRVTAHLVLQVGGVLVADVLAARALVGRLHAAAVAPDVGQAGVDDQRVEPVRRLVAEDWVPKTGVAKARRELDPHRQLVSLPAPRAAAADDLHRAVALQPLAGVGINQLHRDRLLDAFALRVDALAGLEKIVAVQHERKRRDQPQRLGHAVPVFGIVHHVGIHLVIGRVAVPLGRQAGRQLRLFRDLLGKQVGVRVDVAGA